MLQLATHADREAVDEIAKQIQTPYSYLVVMFSSS